MSHLPIGRIKLRKYQLLRCTHCELVLSSWSELNVFDKTSPFDAPWGFSEYSWHYLNGGYDVSV